MDIKFGVVIKMDEAFIKGADKLRESMRQAHFGYTLSIQKYEQATNALFESVHDAYPETEGFDLSYDHKTNEIMILNKKKEK